MAVVASATIIFRDFKLQSNAYVHLTEISIVYFFVLALVLLVILTAYIWGV
ncbi:hypothetical protein IWW55_005926 [Coemansia sp. RSA 2706]|nr:hypothetical protein IWW55_005926 [Coemansia sp. RSA 2706]